MTVGDSNPGDERHRATTQEEKVALGNGCPVLEAKGSRGPRERNDAAHARDEANGHCQGGDGSLRFIAGKSHRGR